MEMKPKPGRPRMDRDSTFARIFRLMNDEPKAIVETGTIRHHAWAASDGHSTIRWANYVRARGGSLRSIDIDKHAVSLSQKLVGSPQDGHDIEIIAANSLDWLAQNECEIDILYLDSANDAELILGEAKLASPNLTDDALILIDDTDTGQQAGVEKGDLAIPWLLDNGWVVELQGYQTLLRRDTVKNPAD